MRLYRKGVSQVEIQRTLGMGEKRVRQIVNRHLGVVPGVTVPGEETFMPDEVAPYFCKPCNAMVTLEPCPACAARAYRKKHRLPD